MFKRFKKDNKGVSVVAVIVVIAVLILILVVWRLLMGSFVTGLFGGVSH